MIEEIRATITGHQDGKSVFKQTGPAPRTEALMYPGAIYWLISGTADGIPSVPAGAPVQKPFFPGPGGTRFLVVSFAPSRAAGPPSATPDEWAEMQRDAEEKFPGLLDAHEADDPAMHASDTVDYVVMLEGELWLQVDGQEEVKLTVGDVVVQNGTRHGWTNKSDKPAMFAVVIVGADRVDE